MDGFIANSGPNPPFLLLQALDCRWVLHLALVLVSMGLVGASLYCHKSNGYNKDCSIHPNLSCNELALQFPHPLYLMSITLPSSQEPISSMHLTTFTILNNITTFMIIHDLHLTIFLIHARICPHKSFKLISPLQMSKLAEMARQLPTLERNTGNFHLTKI